MYFAIYILHIYYMLIVLPNRIHYFIYTFHMSFTFSASTNQISHLSDIFLAISSIGNQALMIISPMGITLYTELSHILNAMVTIEPSLFKTYNFYSEDANNTQIGGLQIEELRLGVDIKLISESFNSSGFATINGGATGQRAPTNLYEPILPTDTSDKSNSAKETDNRNVTPSFCYITYNGEGYPLIIEFEDSMISEKIEFLTFYSDLHYPYENTDEDSPERFLLINHKEIEFEVILKSDVLMNLLKDLQQINTTELYLYVSNAVTQLGRTTHFGGPKVVRNEVNFISKGPIGLLKLLFPVGKSILEKIEVYEKGPNDVMVPVHLSVISGYNFGSFNKIFKSVKLSSKCKISKDLSGTLSIQLLCKNAKSGKSDSGTLINFNMLALILGDNDDEHGGELLVRLNSFFDNESYDYIRAYDKNGEVKNSSTTSQHTTKRRRIELDEYQPIDLQINRTIPEIEDDQQEKEEESRGLVDIPLFL